MKKTIQIDFDDEAGEMIAFRRHDLIFRKYGALMIADVLRDAYHASLDELESELDRIEKHCKKENQVE